MSESFTPEQRRQLADLMLALVDTKQQLGYRYAQWCTSAPTLEAATASSAMAQAELGHSRAMQPLLELFSDLLPAAAIGDEREAAHPAPGLEQEFPSWPAYIAANLIIDGALSTIFGAAVDSNVPQLQSRTRKLLEEERFHAAHASGWVNKLVRSGGPAFQELTTQLERLLPLTLGWLDALPLDALSLAGVLDGGNAELRRRFLAQLRPALAACGLDQEVATA